MGYLLESGKRANRPSVATKLMRRTNAEYDQNIKYMRDLASGLVKGRRDNPTDKNDLLNAMINGRDPKTGEGLRDELICDNMLISILVMPLFILTAVGSLSSLPDTRLLPAYCRLCSTISSRIALHTAPHRKRLTKSVARVPSQSIIYRSLNTLPPFSERHCV